MVGAVSASAQVDQGSITGTVVDSTGAVVPNADVKLLNTDQGLTLETHTGDSGVYTFSPVRIGHYQVTVTAPGFASTTQQNLTVTVGLDLKANISLKTGSDTESVTVSTAPPQLQADESSVGQTIDRETVNNLPLNGRNFTFLAQLSAGVNSAQADTRGNGASGAFTANGLQPAQNNYLLDGIDNNSNAADFLNGTNFVILPPVDAIQEFRVQTADFSAELGRSAGAVLNATIKSGTNSLHGTIWEFFRNDKLDAADWFENNAGTPKGRLRQNQFGASAGGPIWKNKAFFFGDYEGFRRVQGTVLSGTVPTALQRNSGYTNLTELITSQTGAARTDALGRQIPFGTITDPATTRAVTAGVLDPASGIVPNQSGYVRDPFGTCGAGTKVFTAANCNLNQLPANRYDANAIKLLQLFPAPTTGAFNNNYTNSPKLFEHRNAFDVRVDYNPEDKDQIFGRFSYVDDPQFIPGIFGGIADGGGFQQGIQTAKSAQAVLAYTHVFTPSVINVARVGFNHLHTTRSGPSSSVSGIPAQFGIQGIPQGNLNGGLPNIFIGNLANLGTNDYLPSDETSQTFQFVDDFTKVQGRQSFKMGFEYQNVGFNTLQPPQSRGDYSFNSNYAGVPAPQGGGDNTGIAQFLLTPTATTVPGGVSYVGGANSVNASTISKTYDLRKYLAAYFQDDFKVTPELTLNMGLRWDYFSPISETNGAQANFIQGGPPNGRPTYLIPASGKSPRQVSSTANNPALNGAGFADLLAKDGIALQYTDQYGKGVLQTQKSNFAPRFGFAYQATPKLVIRSGIGLFYNAFENAGYGPNIGRNYPFSFSYNLTNNGTDRAPFTSGANSYGTCASAGPGGSATIESGLSCVSFSPLAVKANGIGLSGLQFNFKTPNTLSTNLSVQYAITNNMSFTGAYVYTHASHLQVGVGANSVSQLLPAGTSVTSYVPFPDFAPNSSYQQTLGASVYNGLQTKLEQRLSHGLSYLATYTYSKTMSDAGDLLNGGSVGGFRAPYVPGFGTRADWQLAAFDVRNVFHFSGGYELPYGTGKKFGSNAGHALNTAFGEWSLQYIVTVQNGQPITIGCPTAVTAGTGCNSLHTPGQDPQLGIKRVAVPGAAANLYWFNNPLAFQQPCAYGFGGPVQSINRCVPLTGLQALGATGATTFGPPFKRFDLSLFKNFHINERYNIQFRSEFFNILNHPNFNAPGFGGNGIASIGGATNFNDTTNFGRIGSTRDAPNDPRQIQFALKLYY